MGRRIDYYDDPEGAEGQQPRPFGQLVVVNDARRHPA